MLYIRYKFINFSDFIYLPFYLFVSTGEEDFSKPEKLYFMFQRKGFRNQLGHNR